MISRKIRNVMTREVVAVNQQAPFTEMVRLMAIHKVSALPVVDGDGRLVGIVSEADLLRKEEYQDEQDGPHWLERRRERTARGRRRPGAPPSSTRCCCGGCGSIPPRCW